MGDVKLNSSGGGSVTLTPPSTASNLTVTLPSASGTLATTSGTGSVFTNPTINGFTGDTSVVNIGSGQFYKNTSGNIGIGTSSPAATLDVQASSAIQRVTSTTGTNACYTRWANTGGNAFFGIDNNAGSALGGGAYGLVIQAPGVLKFNTGGSSANQTTLDSSGLFGINVVPDGNSRLQVVENNSASRRAADFYLAAALSTGTPSIRCAKYDNNTTTSNKFIEFTINQNNNGSGQINANGAGAAAFGSFSDSRLKENITALPNQLANICALKPSEFDYKDGSGHQIGFIAQEMQEIYPDVVGEGEDGMLTITGWSKTEARLVKAIQELSAKNSELEFRLAALEGK